MTLGGALLAFAMLSACATATPEPMAVEVAAPAAVVAVASPVQRPRRAEFGAITPSADVRWLANWVAETGDNGSGPFVLVDKRAARLHVFDADARRVASTAVLLGAALGDHTVPGIGTRPMSSIEVHERTTPAGRFVGEPGRNTKGEDIVWVDYDAAVSMHRVRLTNPLERRADRLKSPSVADNRISYGCINVPVAFYERFIRTLFSRQQANIYVLPDVKSVREVFAPAAAVASTEGGSPLLAVGRPVRMHTASQFRGFHVSAK